MARFKRIHVSASRNIVQLAIVYLCGSKHPKEEKEWSLKRQQANIRLGHSGMCADQSIRGGDPQKGR
jgi:hypothetical protein